MKVWYIRYANDDPEDAIWLAEEYQQFFAVKEKAHGMCASLNLTSRSDWKASNESALERWEKVQTAYDGVESLGLDAREVFPHHKREFREQEYKDTFVVDFIEVED